MDGGRNVRQLVAVLAILFALLAFRLVANEVLLQFGLASDPAFFTPNDRFADSLKPALAQTAVSRPLYNNATVANWPPLFQKYLFHNDYLQPGATVHHLPPLSTLLMMGAAAMLLWIPPLWFIGIMLWAYVAGSFAVADAAQRSFSQKVLVPAFVLICLSYPALFMLDRGNIHSGLTSLLVLVYVFSAASGRLRRWGWLALALAANIRPNVAIFAFLELASDRTWREAGRALIAMGVMGLVTGLGALFLAGAIDPTYSLPEFLRSYGWYQRLYVEGLLGMDWNLSLSNLVKIYRFNRNYHDLHDPIAVGVLTASVGVLTLLFVGLYRMGRATTAQFVFAIAASCTLLTPVFAEYHAVIFAAPLLLLILRQSREPDWKALWWGAACCSLCNWPAWRAPLA